MFLMHSGSRRQYRRDAASNDFVYNLSLLCQQPLDSAPHGDSLVYYLKDLPPAELEKLPPKLVRRLIRMKALYPYRLYEHFLIAVDGTGQLFFRERHCPNCLTQTRNGQTLYFHHVLEAKLVTRNGLALSVATEFIENFDPEATKQDCEMKAFYRLAEKLKRYFPQLKICLLLDALYAAQQVFDLCQSYHWQFMVTFKRGSMPALFEEYEALRKLCPENRLTLTVDGELQRLAWVEDLEHGNHRLQALECDVTAPDEHHHFVWLTSFKVDANKAFTLANHGGRLRWKIENEGFNTQKNGGFALEHTYCKDETALKNFYLILQIAHIFNQLMVKGSLFEDFDEQVGALKNLSRLVREHLRNLRIPIELTQLDLTTSIQIRLAPGYLDSS